MTKYLQEVVSGGLGGAAGIALGHPLDLLKVHQQNSSNRCSALSFTLSTYRTSGVGGLFKGLVPPLIAGVVYQSLMFPAYQLALSLFGKARDTESIAESVVAGMFAGLVTTIGTTPLEVAKIQLQLNPSAKGGSAGATRVVLVKMFRSGSMYSGWLSLAVRDGPGTGVYMATYHLCKRLGAPIVPSKSLNELLSGGMAGVFCWLSVLPFDTVKTRIQADCVSSKAPMYKGTFDGLVKIARTEGWPALFAGWRPILLRAFPCNGVTFLVYEKCMALFDHNKV